jgi:hypothetical protein
VGYGLGLEPENRAALDAGTRHHAQKAAAERIAGGSITLGRLLNTQIPHPQNKVAESRKHQRVTAAATGHRHFI